jgi:trimeric autotransporter adhesin
VQVISDDDGVVLASCHCEQFAYHDAYNWNNPTGWTQADDIRYVGAWDATTGKYIPEFLPDGISTRAGHGGWALQPDSNGTLWVGGDFTASRSQSGTTQWTGGFFRLPQRDHTAPTVPANVVFGVTPTGDVKVNFTASVDDSGRPLSYEVLAEDRVVLIKNGTSFTMPMPATPTRFFVRAIDKSGNRSASTAATVVTPSGP